MVDPRFKFTRRKLLAATGAIGVAGAGAGLGTSALFSDTETSSGNSIQAGTLDLEFSDASMIPLSVTDAVPGGSGNGTVELNNTGDADGFLSLKFPRGTNAQNGNNDPEPSSSQNGDLGDVLQVTVSLAGNTVRSGTFNGVFDGTRAFYDTAAVGNGGSKTLDISWTLPTWAGNMVQTDKVEADVQVDLVQDNGSSRVGYFADEVVGSGDNIADVVNNQASSGDTVMLEDSYSGATSNKIEVSDVTLVGETSRGPTVGRMIAARSNVAFIGLDVDGDGEDYAGISLEPNNGATSGVVIRDNDIGPLDGSSPKNNNSKKETYGVLSFSYGGAANALDDLVVAENKIQNIGGDSSPNTQGFGVFVEGTSASGRGATIENNLITNVSGRESGSTDEPGVGVTILPELTNPNNSISQSGVVSNDANATVYNNNIDPEAAVSLAGNLKQVVVAGNDLSGSSRGVITTGNVPADGNNIGIAELDEPAAQSVVSGTARYIQ